MAGVPTAPIPPGVAVHGVIVTPSDDTVFDPPLSKLWVGGTGALSLVMAGDTVAVALTTVPAGVMLYNLGITKIMAATTATEIVGFR